MPDDETTFRLRYVGARFANARLPVDVLSDFAAFRDLLVAFAKSEWKSRNQDRQRLPKGFDKSLSIDLTGVEDGSAIPLLNWNKANAQRNLPGFADELELIVESSFNNIIQLIDGAGNGRFPRVLPSEYVRALNKLGSGLRDGERIEFAGTKGLDGKVVYLNLARRKDIITGVSETYQARFDECGILRGAYADESVGHIDVETTAYGVIEVLLDRDRVMEEFDGNIGQSLQFDLQIELDNKDHFRRVIEVFDIAVFDADVSADLERCRTRLAELRQLESGWHDGEGVALKSAAIEAAEKLIAKRWGLAGAYRIFPTEEGGVLIEFEHNGWDFSLEFSPAGSVEMFGVEIDGLGEKEPQSFRQLDDDFFNKFDEAMRTDVRAID